MISRPYMWDEHYNPVDNIRDATYVYVANNDIKKDMRWLFLFEVGDFLRYRGYSIISMNVVKRKYKEHYMVMKEYKSEMTALNEAMKKCLKEDNND